MPSSFVSEPITPLDGSFDTAMMARGEPGLPHRFRWRKKEWAVAEILEQWKEYGDCAHGSGERYVRKHGYRIRTTEGLVLRLNFQRSWGRAKFRTASRWRIYSMEE
jgi:phosphoribosylglycinamide formyltransferase-1